MSDNIALDAHEDREHAEHAAHSGDPFLRRVSITIALLAVLSAAISSLEANESAAAISAGSEAVLHQDKATDSWGFYQAKTIKAGIFGIAAAAGGPKADFYQKESDRHTHDEDAIRATAQAEEKAAKEATAAQAAHEHHHHLLGFGETVSHVAIAIATIAIITKQRWPWATSMALGVIAAITAGLAYM
jgi:hypothetical protein